MKPKSGTAGTPVSPASPAEVCDADAPDPGEVAEVKAEQIESKSGKYGSEKAKPFKNGGDAPADGEAPADGAPGGGPADQAPAEEQPETSWIEIELVGEDGEPIPGEKYAITLPDGTVAEGTLDENGYARVEGFEEGGCTVTFPDLDKNAWGAG